MAIKKNPTFDFCLIRVIYHIQFQPMSLVPHERKLNLHMC